MKITGSATVLPVTDVDATLRFFTQTLGFTHDFRFGEYAGVVLGDCHIHLSKHTNPNTGTPGSGAVYIFCDEVDAYFAEIRGRGALVDGEPADYPYGMRDFCAYDPDRNKISFGCPAKQK